MKVDILGSTYEIFIETLDGECDGFTDFYQKKIHISNCLDWDNIKQRNIYKNQILRHEIIHAFLFESGLAYNSNGCEHWAMNEEMVDWLAIQLPLIFEVFSKLNCL